MKNGIETIKETKAFRKYCELKLQIKGNVTMGGTYGRSANRKMGLHEELNKLEQKYDNFWCDFEYMDPVELVG